MLNNNGDNLKFPHDHKKDTVIGFDQFQKYRKQKDNEVRDSKVVNVTFIYSEAFKLSHEYLKECSQIKLSTTAFITMAIEEIHKLGLCLNIFENKTVNKTLLNRLNLIPLLNIYDRTETGTLLDAEFKSASDHPEFKPNGDRTTLELPKDSVDTLNLFSELWEEKNRSVLIANISTIYTMLVYERFVLGLTPYSDKSNEFGSSFLWRA